MSRLLVKEERKQSGAIRRQFCIEVGDRDISEMRKICQDFEASRRGSYNGEEKCVI